MCKNNGRFKKGEHRSPKTEFKKGQHWRPHKAFREKEYLLREYVEKQRSTGEISAEWSVKDASILFWLKRHGIPRRTVSEARGIKQWGLKGKANGMYGRKGKACPQWKGGCSPERQAFYSSQEWLCALKAVWKKDGGFCQRCGIKSDGEVPFHIHHIVSFAIRQLRAEPSNLILLCKNCHLWVHSKKNINKEFIKEVTKHDKNS